MKKLFLMATMLLMFGAANAQIKYTIETSNKVLKCKNCDKKRSILLPSKIIDLL